MNKALLPFFLANLNFCFDKNISKTMYCNNLFLDALDRGETEPNSEYRFLNLFLNFICYNITKR